MIGKLRVMAIAIPAIALLGTGASAAASNPPVPARSSAHGALGHASNAKGPDATGPAKHGLCTAFAASAGHAKGHGVAFENLQKAATAGKSVTQFCAGVKPGKGVRGDTGSSGATPLEKPPGGHGKGDHGTPAGSRPSTPAGKS
jgi:hypothetical protein